MGWEVQGPPILVSGVRRICPTACPGLPLTCSVSAGNKLERRLEGQSGTRQWKSLDAMPGSLTLFSSQAEETTVKGIPFWVDCAYKRNYNELAGRETGDRKARKQQLEIGSALERWQYAG